MKIKQVLNSANTKHIRRLLRDLYHRKGPGRKPYNPLAMLKAQLLKHLLRIPSDARATTSPPLVNSALDLVPKEIINQKTYGEDYVVARAWCFL